MHRDDQHRQLGLLGLDHFHEFDPIGPTPKAHVYDREIKFLPPDRVERGETAVGFRADFEVGLLAEELNHAFSKKRVIIDEQNPTSFRPDSPLGLRFFLYWDEKAHSSEAMLFKSYRRR